MSNSIVGAVLGWSVGTPPPISGENTDTYDAAPEGLAWCMPWELLPSAPDGVRLRLSGWFVNPDAQQAWKLYSGGSYDNTDGDSLDDTEIISSSVTGEFATASEVIAKPSQREMLQVACKGTNASSYMDCWSIALELLGAAPKRLAMFSHPQDLTLETTELARWTFLLPDPGLFATANLKIVLGYYGGYNGFPTGDPYALVRVREGGTPNSLDGTIVHSQNFELTGIAGVKASTSFTIAKPVSPKYWTLTTQATKSDESQNTHNARIGGMVACIMEDP